MTWGAVAGAAGTVVGSAISSRGSTSEGKDSKRNRQWQMAHNQYLMDIYRQLLAGGRDDIANLFGEALGAQQSGMSEALQTYKRGMPASGRYLKQGNQNAQQRLIDSQGGIEAALLGIANPSNQKVSTIDRNLNFIQEAQPLPPVNVNLSNEHLDNLLPNPNIGSDMLPDDWNYQTEMTRGAGADASSGNLPPGFGQHWR